MWWREPLLGETEKRELESLLAEMEQQLDAAVAKDPSQEQRMRDEASLLVREFIEEVVNQKRRRVFALSIAACVVGVTVAIFAGVQRGNLCAGLGLCVAVSGLITAILNVPIKRLQRPITNRSR